MNFVIMHYLQTDYFYNLDLAYHTTDSYYTNESKIEYRLLISKCDNNDVYVAISRRKAYDTLGVLINEDEFDIFQIDFKLDIQIEEEDIRIVGDSNLETIEQFVLKWHNMLISFGMNCYGLNEIIEFQNQMRLIIRKDLNATSNRNNDNDIETCYSLSVYNDGTPTIIDNRGNELVRFNDYKNAKKMINLLFKTLRRLVSFIQTIHN